jgi:electron transport complex protein RnfD
MDDNAKTLIVAAPHLHAKISTPKIMWSVSACLAPAGLWGVAVFGVGSLFVLLASIASALLTELIITRLQNRHTLLDGSAFLTGLLIGYNMPPSVPGFIPVLASVFAIAVVKHTFGGLGRNWMNPALAGRVFVLFSWTRQMTTWTPPKMTAFSRFLGATQYDAFTGATPLSRGAADFLTEGTYWDLFIGNISGSLGEVSALLLLVGAIYLLARKIVTWHIPTAFLGSFALMAWLFGGLPDGAGLLRGDVLFHLLTGGLVLGAFYMATDMVTSPLTGKGMIIYGLGAGLLTFLIRFYGGFPEGVSLAIILMNIGVPLIDRTTKPVIFGAQRAGREGGS